MPTLLLKLDKVLLIVPLMTLHIKRRRLQALAELTHTLGCPCIVLSFPRTPTEDVLHRHLRLVNERFLLQPPSNAPQHNRPGKTQ